MSRSPEYQRKFLRCAFSQIAPFAASMYARYSSAVPAPASVQVPVPPITNKTSVPAPLPSTPPSTPVPQDPTQVELLPTAQIPLKTGKPRVVILGTGWAGASLAYHINPKFYDIMVVSPRNHMVFTPLLASTTVGTLEFRSVVMPIMNIQKALHWPQNKFFAANALQVLPETKKIICKADDGQLFGVDYDKLVICTGSQGSTFNIPGVHEYTSFLRDVSHAAYIRDKLIANVGKANIPGRTLLERQRLLHTVVVGGGPTGVEFAGELSDLINQDLKRVVPARAQDLRVTLIEAAELLGSFEKPLREYAARRLTKLGVRLVQGVVREVRETEIELRDGRVFPYGLCVWSTGVGPTPFTNGLPFAKSNRGRLLVNGTMNCHLPKGWTQQSQEEGAKPKEELDGEVIVDKDVFALGDCCANDQKPLPALAQVAEQQGRYLAKSLNEIAKKGGEYKPTPFEYHHLGSMATVGDYKAVFQMTTGVNKYLSTTGFFSWVAWRSAYLTRLASINKKIRVATDWTAALFFGRDLSRW